MSFTIDDKAYAKLMLHCLKHTTKDCYGILIGNETGDKVTITDSIPLFHDRVFAPQLEIALKFIELFTENETQKIIGVYENVLLNNNKDSQNISPYVNFICETIHAKKFKSPIIFEISSNDPEEDSTEMAVQSEIIFKIHRYVVQSGGASSYDLINSSFKESQTQYDLVNSLIKENRLADVIDFDDHFQDVSLDWRNTFVDNYLK